MVIYIEYVLIDNFIIDYFLLSAAFALTGVKVKRGRLFLSACFGALTALVLPFITDISLILVLLKLLIGLLMIIIANKFTSLKSLYIHFIIFFLYTAIVGGAIIALFNILNLDYTKEISTALMVFPVCMIINLISRAINFFYQKKPQISNTVNVILYKGNVKVSANGFFDTGNGAYHHSSPVVFCSKGLAKPFLASPLSLNPFYISVETINGSDKKFAFNLDKIEIYSGEKKNIYNNVTLCVINSGVDGLCDVILHPALMESNDENSIVQIKKVS